MIPASGFYEWEHRGRARLPWVFGQRDGQPFGFAGLWDSWLAPGGKTLEPCAVITTSPNDLISPIHHRMPVMFGPTEMEAWLDPDVGDPARLAPLLCTPSNDGMTATVVSRRSGNFRYDAPDCLAAAEADDDGGPSQLSLGL